MNGKVFVDTNVLVYALDRTAGEKHRRARAAVEWLWINGNGALSTQVLQELCVNLGRKTEEVFSSEETATGSYGITRNGKSWLIPPNQSCARLILKSGFVSRFGTR
jgi:predicted nucleic acid-binding protein